MPMSEEDPIYQFNQISKEMREAQNNPPSDGQVLVQEPLPIQPQQPVQPQVQVEQQNVQMQPVQQVQTPVEQPVNQSPLNPVQNIPIQSDPNQFNQMQ